MSSPQKEGKKLTGMQCLLRVMDALRDPVSGCPWDLKQSMESLVPYTIEEAYEVADAISKADMNDIRSELGDLLFQVVFYAQLAREQKAFDFDEVAQTMSDKLIRRHPHVFGDEKANDADDVGSRWEQIKRQERQGKNKDASVFADVPGNLPALLQAGKVQKRVASVGFDWDNAAQVLDKVKEETDEVQAELAVSQPSHDRLEDEIGDLLFAVVNLARHTKVNPETALRRANYKFMERFREVEAIVSDEETAMDELSLDALELRWKQAKKKVAQRRN